MTTVTTFEKALPAFPQLTFKKLKSRRTMDGGAAFADVYLNGVKIGEFIDNGDGGPAMLHCVNADTETTFAAAVRDLDLITQLQPHLQYDAAKPTFVDLSLSELVSFYVEDQLAVLEQQRAIDRLKKKLDMILAADDQTVYGWKKGVTLSMVARGNLPALQRTYDKMLAQLPASAKVLNSVAQLTGLGVTVQPERHVA